MHCRAYGLFCVCSFWHVLASFSGFIIWIHMQTCHMHFLPLCSILSIFFFNFCFFMFIQYSLSYVLACLDFILWTSHVDISSVFFLLLFSLLRIVCFCSADFCSFTFIQYSLSYLSCLLFVLVACKCHHPVVKILSISTNVVQWFLLFNINIVNINRKYQQCRLCRQCHPISTYVICLISYAVPQNPIRYCQYLW